MRAGTEGEAQTAPALPTTSHRISGRSWADVAVLLCLCVLGVIGFQPPFGGYSFLLAGLGGLAVGTGIALLAARLQLGAVTTALAAIVGYFLLGTALATPGLGLFAVLPTLRSLSALAVGAVYGWSDVVTLQTPIGAPDYINVVPYLAGWLVSLVAVTLATRWLTVRPRTAWRLGIMLLGPIALYLAGILIGTDVAYLAGIRGVTFSVLALVWIGWRRRPSGQVEAASAARLLRRKLGGTAVLVVAAVLAGTGIALAVAPPNENRYVLREEIEPPFEPLDYASPLAGFRHYSKVVTDEPLFTAEGLQRGDRIRLATMDSFTGKLWNVTGPEASTNGSGSFSLVGRALPKSDFLTVDHQSQVTITIEGYDDVWIPGVGYPTDIEFTKGAAADNPDNLRYNAATGSAVHLDGLKKGDRYTISSLVQAVPTLDELAQIGTASVELPPVYSTPDIVTARAGEFAGSATTPAAQLENIRRTLADTGFLSHGLASDTVASRAGHGADRIEELFTRTQMVGDEEQYASAFALMARSLGYPARVVMGFAPELVEGQNTVEVLGSDVTAWVEVAFKGVGWVPYNPTPDETDIPQDEVPEPQTEPQPQVRQPPRVDQSDDTLLTPIELDKADKDEEDLFLGIPGWVFALGIGLLIPAVLIFAPLLVIAWIKSRRLRRRRGAETEHDKAAGAWEELVDQFSELGYEVPGKSTRVMIAERLETQLAAAPPVAPQPAAQQPAAQQPAAQHPVAQHPVALRSLAVATDEAVFSGEEVSEEASGQVWTETFAAIELGRAGLTRARRILSRYRIRSARDWASKISTKRDNS